MDEIISPQLYARALVAEKHNTDTPDQDQMVTADDVLVVWFCKTLQNWKGLFIVPAHARYYEVTHNGDKRETYVDVYVKISNHAVPLD